jgi:DNA polymerase III sliding clamp (beta) subunit (PCNA family)
MITIQQEILHAALSAVTRASLKSSLTALSLVRMDTYSTGALHLSCFNGETAARAIVQASCEEQLSVCVDALTLKAVVETLDSQIELFTQENSLVIQSSTNRTTLRIVNEDLPVIGNENMQIITAVPGTILRSVSRILPFASTDNARYVLQVLHLTFTRELITARTADGYSAGCVQETIEGPVEETSVSLPLNFAKLLSSMVEDRDIVRVGTSGENRYIFQITNADTAKDLTLATVAGSENFPATQINTFIGDARKATNAHLTIQQASLAQSIRMVNAMGTQSTFIKAVDGIAKIASAETETGQGRNILEGTASGGDASVWLSAAFLKRAADACKGELTMRISSGQKPVLIEAGSFTAVIMPMLVEGQKDPFLAEEQGIAISLPNMAMA